MILYFASRKMEILGLASTGLKSTNRIVSDSKNESVSTGVATLEADILFSPETRLALQDLTSPGNYVFRYEASEHDEPSTEIQKTDDFYTITESKIDALNRTVNIYCEGGGIDLINDVSVSLTNTDMHDPAYYVTQAISGSGTAGSLFIIGRNDFEGDQKIISWSDEKTVLNRLQDIAGNWTDCEITYSFDISNMEITGRYIDICKKRGEVTDEVLYLNRNLNNLTLTRSIENMATAIYPTGSDSLTLDGYVPTNPDPDILLDNGWLKYPGALNDWARFGVNSSLGHIYKEYSSSATDQESLYLDGVKELKRISTPELTYELDVVALPNGVGLGDTLNIVDDEGEIYASGRILELETSVTNQTVTATFGDYATKSSGISDKVTALAEKFEEVSIRTIYAMDIVSSNDVVNGNVSGEYAIDTVLTVKLYKNGSPILSVGSLRAGEYLQWYKDGQIISGANNFDLEVKTNETSKYTCRLERQD